MRRPSTQLIVMSLATSVLIACEDTTPPTGARPVTAQLEEVPGVDTTPPVIVWVIIAGPEQTGPGWWNTDVVIQWACDDGPFGSGVVESEPTKTLSAEGANQQVTVTCVDNAGNSRTELSNQFVSIDKTPPSLAPTVSPNPVVLNSSATVSPNASDALSGVATTGCRPVVTSSVGPKTVLCFASDSAANFAEGTADYIVAWPFTGFVGLNAAPALNHAKTGGSMQVKFSLGGNRGLAILAAGSPSSQPISCGTSAPVVTALMAPTGAASSLSYNARTDAYTYDWKTDKSWAGTCRQLSMKLVDGTEHAANFQFTK